MPSPFPGVDPFVEAQHYWQDFHLTFINAWRDAINTSLPSNYEARFEEHVEILELSPEEARLTRPDIAVVRLPGKSELPESSQRSPTAILEPAYLPIPVVEEVHERWIEILHRPGREVVAVLELLSPSNKSSSRGQYLAKRAKFHSEDVHLVEVDLLMNGARLPMGRPLPAGDCYAIVARADGRPTAEVYAWTLHSRLPAIPVPLLKPDKDIHVDLSEIYSESYDRGRYGRSIDYAAPLALSMDSETKLPKKSGGEPAAGSCLENRPLMNRPEITSRFAV